jgi:hypothetical protein
MQRRRFRDLSCAAKDAAVWTSFAWEELRDLAVRMFYPLDEPAGSTPGSAVAVMCAVHRACDEENTFSGRIEELLEEMHEETVLRVAATAPDELISWLGADLSKLPLPLAGFVWAVVSDPRESMRILEQGLLWRLHAEGLRTLAFGKVELITI